MGGDKQPPTRASPIIPSVHRSHQSIPGADRTDRRLSRPWEVGRRRSAGRPIAGTVSGTAKPILQISVLSPGGDPVTNTWAMARSYVTTARNAAIADVLVRRLSLGVLVCDRVWLNRPVGGCVFGVGVGDRLGLVHLSRLAGLRGVDGVGL